MQKTQSRWLSGGVLLAFAGFKAYRPKWAGRILTAGTLASIPLALRYKDWKKQAVHLEALGAAFAGFAVGALIQRDWMLATLSVLPGAVLYKVGNETWPRLQDVEWCRDHPDCVDLLKDASPIQKMLFIWKIAESEKDESFKPLCERVKELLTVKELKEHLSVINDREWHKVKENGQADLDGCEATWSTFVKEWVSSWKEAESFEFAILDWGTVEDRDRLMDKTYLAFYDQVQWYGKEKTVVVDGIEVIVASPARLRIEQSLSSSQLKNAQDKLEACKDELRVQKVRGERDLDVWIKWPGRVTGEKGLALGERYAQNIAAYGKLRLAGTITDLLDGKWIGLTAEQALALQGIKPTPALVQYIKHFL